MVDLPLRYRDQWGGKWASRSLEVHWKCGMLRWRRKTTSKLPQNSLSVLKKKKLRVPEIVISMANVSHQQSVCLPAEKECLGTCVQNMQQSDDLSPLEIVDMFAGLSCFLKDSSDVSQTLLDDFRMCQGYAFLCDLMLRCIFNLTGHAVSARFPECSNKLFLRVSRLEQAKEDESKDALKDLVNLVTCLTTYGVTELKPAGLTTGAPFLLPGFVLPQPSGKGVLLTSFQKELDSFAWWLYRRAYFSLRRWQGFRLRRAQICYDNVLFHFASFAFTLTLYM